ncbi:hypothetical protein LFX25_20705 [Leptospira sp. FAT2]|uniref:hypothetical protein n=1 Tax=Leptospira sanjuanensis TaxID=2879643 RepID=UPI001EE7A090|nr:hypothetical protein [Leptospira sanjuanensis]MCG6195667.1 hypothetical protein [Leptospira sanjuanensis]
MTFWNFTSQPSINLEFINLFKKAFPNTEPGQVLTLDEMLKQFRKRELTIKGFSAKFEERINIQITKDPHPVLMQGDIIDGIPILILDNNGNLSELRTPSVIISASCDCENDSLIIFAGCYPFSEVKNHVKSEKDLFDNLYYKFFTFANSSDDSKSLVADFTKVSSFSKTLIEERIREGKINKIASLTQLGYYYFITKLYIHFLRVENQTALDFRK